MSLRREHWQGVYAAKGPTEVSWYAEHLTESLDLIDSVASPEARVIDVGGGASTLVDDLLEVGYRNLTVLDVAEAALEAAERRLGPRAAAVTWLAADVTSAELPAAAFDIWHDRAVLQFLTEEADRAAYLTQLRRALVPGGQVVVGTFSLAGPAECSGLEVIRYDAPGLVAVFGEEFLPILSFETVHRTPAGREQAFLYAVLRRGGSHTRPKISPP